MKTGDVWKYGTTRHPKTRNPLSFYERWGLIYEREFTGPLAEALASELDKILFYEAEFGIKPPGNKIRRYRFMHLLKGLQQSRNKDDLHFRITSDANEESRVGKVVCEISGPTRKRFTARNYGLGLRSIVIVLTCCDPELNFKQRLRFKRSTGQLYMDIMLDLEQMCSANHAERRRIILGRLADEVPAIVQKYSIRDFDTERFIAELKQWLAEIEPN